MWKSVDNGESWVQVSTAPWSRKFHATVAAGSKVILTGGFGKLALLKPLELCTVRMGERCVCGGVGSGGWVIRK